MPIRYPCRASAPRPCDIPMALSETLKRGEIGASLKGQFYQYQRHGKWVTAKWPKKRGKAKSPAQLQAEKDFASVCRAIKLTAAEVQMYARANAAGTPMLPRDAMMAALYGNGPTIRTYSGKVIKPMAHKLLSSTVLDAIGWQEGDILYRSSDSWEVLRAGGPGQVLTMPELGKVPAWAPPSGGGAPRRVMNPISASVPVETNITFGNSFYWYQEVVIRRVGYVPYRNLGTAGTLTIATINNTWNIVDILAQKDFSKSGWSLNNLEFVDLDAPLVISPDQRVGIVFTCTEGTSSTREAARRGETWVVNASSFPVQGIRLGVRPVIGSRFISDPNVITAQAIE